HLCRIDQCHTELDSEPQCGDFILVRPGVLAHAPGALTQYSNALTIAKRNSLHFMLVIVLVLGFGGRRPRYRSCVFKRAGRLENHGEENARGAASEGEGTVGTGGAG